MRFFTPDGEEMNIGAFVEQYSSDYFLKAPGDEGFVPGLRRSSKYIEGEITSILCSGIKGKRDIARILAWKIGKIKHGESEKKSIEEGKAVFIYSHDWEDADELKGVRLYDKEHEFPIDTIAEYLTDPKNDLEKKAAENAQLFLKEIGDKDFPRIGSVYMITLLYFFSRGKYPIFDRFAMMALNAAKDGNRPGEAVKTMTLPDKNSKKRFDNIMSCEMSAYTEQFNSVFDEYRKTDTSGLTEIKMKRKLDQALWVYGHLFTDGKKSSCR